MAAASYVQLSFLGGEWSKSFQGRIDQPNYRTAMNVCLNGVPLEQGAWTRRPGTRFCATTRNGAAGRVLSFQFKQSSPYAIELTAGFFRFFAGPVLAKTNDPLPVVSISPANPAVVTVGIAGGWATGQQVQFQGTLVAPQIQNRTLAITVLTATTFSIADAVTGEGIDGNTLGASSALTVFRILEIATPYTTGMLPTLRMIQADIPISNATTPGAVFLHPLVKPYVLKVETAPTTSAFASFSFAPVNFKDGPYFDPVPGGTLATPSALNGNINLTLSFNAWDATRSYAINEYVTSGGVNYKSLQDGNFNHVPPNASFWIPVSADDAIGPNGFQGSDVGRMVRLYSEPAIWLAATVYAAGAVVAYGGAGLQYLGATYWKSLVAANTGNTPGTDLTKWALFPQGAIWSWGKILGLSNIIDRALAGSVAIGDMTLNGGLAASFDGITAQAEAACSKFETTGSTFFGAPPSIISYVGKNYTAATDQKIGQATVYPSSDFGFSRFLRAVTLNDMAAATQITLNLRGKASAPASSSDGTLLGSTALSMDTTSPVTVISTDLVTAWKFVWVEIVSTITPVGGLFNWVARNLVAELQLFGPPGTGTAQGVEITLLGDPLLYTTPVRVWRLGLYSDTTGWPRCGTYHEGRLWLSGAVDNRIDSSKSNDIFNFAPTNPDGSVSGNNGISYIFNSPDVNPIFWMTPDHQGIVCGTQSGEWLVQATSNNLPLTPTTIQAHRYTTYGCADIEPRRTDNTLAVVQVFRRDLLEYFSEVYSGKFGARDLLLAAKHLVASGVAEVAVQQEMVPIIWLRCDDGSLIGATYGRQSLVSSEPPEFCGWHRHELGSSRIIESICAAANADGTLDVLAMVTNDPDVVAGRQVEMLTNFFTEVDPIGNAWFLDNAAQITSWASQTDEIELGGLWHLNGQTVQVFANGLDCGQTEFGITDFVVSNGIVTVPFGDGISGGTGMGLFTKAFADAAVAAGQIVVGLTYNSDGQIVRPALPAESGARSGPAFAKTKRTQRFGVQVVKTAGLSVGTVFEKLDPVLFTADSGARLEAGQTFTGIYRDALVDDYSLESMLAWRISRPLPAMIAAIGGFIQTQDS